MKHELNAHSITCWIRQEHKDILPKLSNEELWELIVGYTNNEIELDYIYDNLISEVKR